MAPLPLNHRYTGTDDGSNTTTTYIPQDTPLSSNYPKLYSLVVPVQHTLDTFVLKFDL